MNTKKLMKLEKLTDEFLTKCEELLGYKPDLSMEVSFLLEKPTD